jgi:hypothetical protein
MQGVKALGISPAFEHPPQVGLERIPDAPLPLPPIA